MKKMLPHRSRRLPTRVVISTPSSHEHKEYHQWYPDLYGESPVDIEMNLFKSDVLQLYQLVEETLTTDK